jgi:Chaperone of endosialidase
MPLAPQITNTPIPYSTWYSAGDYDSSATAVVVPTSTYYAAPTPNASAIGDIWFDTTNGNKQYRWDGSSWVAVQDTAIASAYSLATTANANATAASATANGKNVVTYSTASYSGSGTRQGDIWFQYQSGTGVILNQWTWNGSSWDTTKLSDAVIASVTAGKITAGTIMVNVGISNNSGTFSVDAYTGALNASSATISGTITSSNGTIGGFSIQPGYINYGGTYLMATNGNGQQSTYSFFSDRGVYASTFYSTGSSVFNGSITAASGINISGGSLTLGGGLYGITSGGAGSFTSVTTGAGSYSLSNSGQLTAASSYVTNVYDTNLNITNTVNLYGGYGVISDWSPNTDNTYNLGISGSRRWSHVYANNTTITTSDQRLKTNIVTSPLGLNFIESLRPVAYQWIEGGKQLVLDDKKQPIIESTDANGKPVYKTESIPGKRTHYGLIAQEVKAALDNANVGDFAGWVQDDVTNPDSTQSISYEQFIAPLIKAVQELSARVTKLGG